MRRAGDGALAPPPSVRPPTEFRAGDHDGPLLQLERRVGRQPMPADLSWRLASGKASADAFLPVAPSQDLDSRDHDDRISWLGALPNSFHDECHVAEQSTLDEL